jgi:hypothetical protein
MKKEEGERSRKKKLRSRFAKIKLSGKYIKLIHETSRKSFPNCLSTESNSLHELSSRKSRVSTSRLKNNGRGVSEMEIRGKKKILLI